MKIILYKNPSRKIHNQLKLYVLIRSAKMEYNRKYSNTQTHNIEMNEIIIWKSCKLLLWFVFCWFIFMSISPRYCFMLFHSSRNFNRMIMIDLFECFISQQCLGFCVRGYETWYDLSCRYFWREDFVWKFVLIK